MPMLFMRTVSGLCVCLCVVGLCVHVFCAFLGHSESGGVSEAGQLCHDHSSQAPWQAGLEVGGGACSHVAVAFVLGLWLQCCLHPVFPFRYGSSQKCGKDSLSAVRLVTFVSVCVVPFVFVWP